MKFDRKRKRACFLLACILSIAGVGFGMLTEKKQSFVTGLPREETGTQVRLFVKTGQETLPVTIRLSPRQRTEKEKEDLLEEAYEEVLSELRGENPSLQEIHTDLNMIYECTVRGEEIAVFWQVPEGVPMSSTGIVSSPETVERHVIYLQLSLGEFRRQWDVHLTFLPKSEKRQTVSEYIQSAVDKQEGADYIALPAQYEGNPLLYQAEEETSFIVYAIPGLLAGVCLWLMFYHREEKEKERRRKELEHDYPDFAMKIALLYKAGLSMRSIWERLAKEESVGRALKEEIQKVVRKITGGVPETAAYWEFGELCGSQEYRKLAGILEQTVVKGAKGLTQLLDDTARESLQERKSIARQKGEEISTKLLLPMGLILVVVIVLVMMPAISTMKSGV